MTTHLTVTNPFGQYQRGALISDASEVAAILSSDNAGDVVPRVVADEKPKAEAPKVRPVVVTKPTSFKSYQPAKPASDAPTTSVHE